MSKRLQMPEEKSKRIAVGATIGGVLLFVVLLVVMIIQFVQMGAKQRILNEIEDAKAEMQQKIDDTEHDLAWWESWFGRYSAALKQDYVFPDKQ